MHVISIKKIDEACCMSLSGLSQAIPISYDIPRYSNASSSSSIIWASFRHHSSTFQPVWVLGLFGPVKLQVWLWRWQWVQLRGLLCFPRRGGPLPTKQTTDVRGTNLQWCLDTWAMPWERSGCNMVPRDMPNYVHVCFFHIKNTKKPCDSYVKMIVTIMFKNDTATWATAKTLGWISIARNGTNMR
jgi:hypothetical protein